MVLPIDDEEPDRQEVVDTPDGKPTAEWLVLRKHAPHKVPLEETVEWEPLFEPSFDEVPLFSGKIRDAKRKQSESVGVLKCKVNIFRKEDETANGKSRKYPDREPCFYEVGPKDVSVEAALDLERPYKMKSIMELYPEATVEVRVYVIRAFQITPGGLEREAEGKKFWEHIVTADLGKYHAETEVVRALNPKMFHTFQFKNMSLPGPSILKLGVKDISIFQGNVTDEVLVGETSVDLEDRWFCQKWRDAKYKPREVRDLFNEDATKGEQGVSQGKLSIIVDVLEQNKADEMPPEDIQVLGKTQNCELRVVVWNTHDTACKDTYTSDVYIKCELIGVGQPKQTDVHYGVKKGAYGMFNWRLKWRAKYPSTTLEYLMRIQVWDDNMVSTHASIAEGILPLGPLFKECFERNQGKTSPDDMEDVWLLAPGVTGRADQTKEFVVDEDGFKNPTLWTKMTHPNTGYNPNKDCQCKLQMSFQVMPRAKARAAPAGSKRMGPSKLPEPNRPPQPANPLLYPEKCRAYIVYTCVEFFKRCKGPCLCCLCCLLLAAIIGLLAGMQMAFPGL